MASNLRKHPLMAAALMACFVIACAVQGPGDGALHRWWTGLGPVLPHDTFPGDCRMCHEGDTWNAVRPDFRFDHEKETGVPLNGAHSQAMCLRCHNDRGPVAMFAAKGCAGCHEDVHRGRMSTDCTSCHQEHSWYPTGQVEMHNRTRFPLVGVHMAVACSRCHPGAFVGEFVPTDSECVTCHQDDLIRTTNPPHVGLGWVDNCQRCHIPTNWHQVRIPVPLQPIPARNAPPAVPR